MIFKNWEGETMLMLRYEPKVKRCLSPVIMNSADAANAVSNTLSSFGSALMIIPLCGSGVTSVTSSSYSDNKSVGAFAIFLSGLNNLSYD